MENVHPKIEILPGKLLSESDTFWPRRQSSLAWFTHRMEEALYQPIGTATSVVATVKEELLGLFKKKLARRYREKCRTL